VVQVIPMRRLGGVKKHTTCSDVDDDGVKRRVEIPVRRCRHRDVDVGAVLLGTSKARKTKTRTHKLMSKNLERKELTKVVKICVKITPDFVSNCQLDVKRGNMVLKRGQAVVKRVCRPALAGLGRL
jgi:hypothetical protein